MRVYDPSVAEPYDVLFSMPWAGPLLAGSGASGGAETQILLVARALAADGLRVAIAVIGDRSSLPLEIDGVELITRRRPPRLRGVAGLLHDWASLTTLVRTPSRVIVTRAASRGVALGALAARMRRAGFIYSSANLVDFDFGRMDSRFNVRLYERGVRAADEVVVQNDEQAELCRGRFHRDPVVIRSVAERAEPRSGTPDAFLWIGRLVEYKRVDVYLDLAADVPEARFQLIAVPGPGEQPELNARLERAQKELPNLEVLEPRPRAEVAPLVERAVAMVGTGDAEGMPNVFLEGWSRGVPALVFQLDPDGIVERHGLGGFAAGSRERLAELARSIWAARADQRELAERCLAYVHREHAVESVSAAWREVITAVGRR